MKHLLIMIVTITCNGCIMHYMFDPGSRVQLINQSPFAVKELDIISIIDSQSIVPLIPEITLPLKKSNVHEHELSGEFALSIKVSSTSECVLDSCFRKVFLGKYSIEGGSQKMSFNWTNDKAMLSIKD